MPALFSTRLGRPKRPINADAFLHTHMANALHNRTALAQNYSQLVTSVGDLALTDDVPSALKNHYSALQPNGLFMAAFYGGGTLQELRTSLLAAETAVRGGAATRVAPMLAVGTAAELMQRAGFTLPVIDSEVTTVTYASLGALVADLRAADLTGALAQHHFLPRAVWQATSAYYMKYFTDPRGRLCATFETIFLSGWKNP